MLTGDLMERLEQMFVEEGKSQKAAKGDFYNTFLFILEITTNNEQIPCLIEAKKLPAGPPPTVDPSVPTQSVIASRYKGLIG